MLSARIQVFDAETSGTGNGARVRTSISKQPLIRIPEQME
jgi:hypothetical protein